MVKKIFIYLLILIFYIFFIEIFSRFFIYTISKDVNVFKYGFDKFIKIYVNQLSKLNISIDNQNSNLTYQKVEYINNSKKIYIFGGSTSKGFNCDKSSWPNELQALIKNFKIVNFADYGLTTDTSLNELEKIIKKEIPKKILWANKYNEQQFISHGISRNQWLLNEYQSSFLQKKIKYNILRFHYTLRSNFVSYFVLDEIIKRSNHLFFGTPKNILINKKYSEKEIEFIIRNYEINTTRAIKIAKKYNIDFYIISLFGRYDFETRSFHEEQFYKKWFEKVLYLEKKWNIKLIITENFAKLEKENKNFCDAVHQHKAANIETAKIIYKFIN